MGKRGIRSRLRDGQAAQWEAMVIAWFHRAISAPWLVALPGWCPLGASPWVCMTALGKFPSLRLLAGKNEVKIIW